MASNPLSADRAPTFDLPAHDAAAGPTFRETIETILAPVASLRLTVILLSLSVLLVFFGTVAQWQKDIWEVVNEYFRCWFAYVSFEDLIPPKMWPGRPKLPGGFWFFGGNTLLVGLGANLLAAHGIRFRIQAQGARLLTGLFAIAIGLAATWLVIQSGSSSSGIYAGETFSWDTFWNIFKVLLAVTWLGLIYLAMSVPRGDASVADSASPGAAILFGIIGIAATSTKPVAINLLRYSLWAAVIVIGLGVGYIFYAGDAAKLDPSSMRILWQLAKGTFAGLVLLAGCYLVFKQRAPVVVLHAGLGLMMANELVVHFLHVESQMRIYEGQTATYTEDSRHVELAISVPEGTDDTRVTVVPHELLQTNVGQSQPISHPALPCDIRVLKYLRNSTITPRKDAKEENLANAGIGLQWNGEEQRAAAGADAGGSVDFASAYVQLLEKQTGRELGTYLVSQYQDLMPVLPSTQPLELDGKRYDLSLRFHRIHKPYSITLEDIRKNDYVGTDTPRDYSSYIRLVDEELKVDEKLRVWMNNPLRFRDETFYQSGYHKDPVSGKEHTTLQVVSNFGWMIPYVSCMIVVVGMVAQFGATLLRFAQRRAEGRTTPANAAKQKSRDKSAAQIADPLVSLGDYVMIGLALLVGVASLGYAARVPAPKADEFNLYEFGQIPVAFEGRVKPLDTLARNTLRIVSNTETFVDRTVDKEKGKREPAIKWFLDVVTEREVPGEKGSEPLVAAEQHQVFKIDNFDVQSLLGLPPRQRHRFAVGEFRGKAQEFNDAVAKMREKAKSVGEVNLSPKERALADLDTRVRRYTLMQGAFHAPNFGQLPTNEEFEKNREDAQQRAGAILQRFQGWLQVIEDMKPARAIPAGDNNAKEPWQIMAVIDARDGFMRQIGNAEMKPPAAYENLRKIFRAYIENDPKTFNLEVARYHASLREQPPSEYRAAVNQFEAYFNHFRPFYLCWMLYLLAFVLAAGSWLGFTRPLSRAAFWLLVFTLVVHTWAIVARIYISGRPPVTNLYTTAIFIGWGCVVLGLILEWIYKLGIGSFVAAAIGVLTLEVADRLAADGDTFTVLQAVLDTQFWLSTHVVCINLGYATTVLAGVLGIVYVLRGVLTPSLTPEVGKDLARMIYGTLCFATFFSFWGTVLGGLWADDSWGRFWGWDPKENGALMIVLWNAIVLHARWGALVKERGMAVLVIVGNIVTHWSWFAVNDLGMGLHAYVTAESRFGWFYLFSLIQLGIVAIGCLPTRVWWSNQAKTRAA